jgi:hypothetical protein
MGKINWGRVVLCGALTGAVWGALYAIVFPFVARDFMAALPGGFGGIFPGTSAGLRGIVFVMPLALGISTMWLYASIRPRYGPGPKTAAMAGFALWFFVSWVDASWAAVGAVSLGALVGPVAASLPIVLVAAVGGALLYKE